jgi:ketosteroid isomerase-like protein
VTDDDVLAANDAFYAAFNRKDMSAMDEVWARTVEVGCIHPGWNVLRGREAVMTSWQGILANPAQPKIMTGGASVTMIGDLALVFCRELVAGTPLAASNLFVLEDGAWKMAHHHSSPVSLVGQ